MADPEGHQVLFINPKLETILGRITAPLISPAGIFVWDQQIFITDSSLHQILLFKKNPHLIDSLAAQQVVKKKTRLGQN